MNLPGRMIGVIIILFSTCFEALGQFAFKRAADRRPAGVTGPIGTVLANVHWIFLGWLAFIVEGLFWSAALYFLDVSVAHPIGSVVFVVVTILARIFLGEKVSARRWMGICFILGGTVLVAFN